LLYAAPEAADPEHLPQFQARKQAQLSEAIAVLQQHGSLKLWQLPGSPMFTTPAALSSYVRQQCIPQELQQLLPDPAPSTQPAGVVAAAAKFQMRMQQLHRRLLDTQKEAWDLWGWDLIETPKWRKEWSDADLTEQMRCTELLLVCDLLDALQQEHQQLLQALLQPMESWICEQPVGVSWKRLE
jgi:hypothetical protein